MLQICDFGLAKWKKEAETQTATGKRRGTFAYMAPEVFENPFQSRTVKYDVYSFGIFLWELLSGQKAFEDGKCTYIMHLSNVSLLNEDIELHNLGYGPKLTNITIDGHHVKSLTAFGISAACSHLTWSIGLAFPRDAITTPDMEG